MIPDVSVSVVTHNNEGCADALIRDLQTQEGVAWEVFVFDNASSDTTRDILCRSGSVSVFECAENLGYSKGHNRNIRQSTGRYVLLLNPDVRFSPGMMSGLVGYLDRHPDVALAGPRILEGGDRRHFAPRRFYPGEGMVALEPGLRRSAIAWLNGCCILARRSTLCELGGFDEDYFLYQGETDLCLRARRLGFTLGWVPEVVVHHIHRQSQRDISDYEYSRRLFEGSAVFWRKHYAPADMLGMAQFQMGSSRLLSLAGQALDRVSRRPPELNPERLRARRDVCRELIASNPPDGKATGAVARIALRQVRLAAESIRQGRFPLDDY
ncbi:MAG: glycosyltransferase family 2 protein [Gemmatimonadaceae bacterium]